MKKQTYDRLRVQTRSRNRDRNRQRTEQGQTIVVVALIFVALVAVAGLAVDGGNLFVQRRQAQNAADAAALAGTRMVTDAMVTCDNLDLDDYDIQIARKINDYAEQNGIPDTNGIGGDEFNDNVVGYYVDPDLNILATVGQADTLPLGTAGIRVEVNASHETYFVPVIGVETIPSSAVATAMTGAAKQLTDGAGLLPIGVPEEVVDGIPPGIEWEVHDNLDARFCYTDEYGVDQCIDEPDAPHNAQRAWLNLNHIFNKSYLLSTDDLNRTFESPASADGCPSDPNKLPGLPGYASGLCPYKYPIIAGNNVIPGMESQTTGDFIHGSSGSDAVGTITIYKNMTGQTAMAPVFDMAFLRAEMVTHFGDGAEAPEGWPTGGGFSSSGGGTGNSYYYHIVGYTAFVIGDQGNPHNLDGTFVNLVVASGFLPDGYQGPQCTSMVYGLALWD